jgi:glutathione S-transferase
MVRRLVALDEWLARARTGFGLVWLAARGERRAPVARRGPSGLREATFTTKQAWAGDPRAHGPASNPMKLYYSPQACSLSAHIALHESGLAFQAVPVNTRIHSLQDGTDFFTLNPKGYVPLLELADGTRLSEGAAILQWIADQVPDKRLAPAAGTMDRYRLQEWLAFIGTEIHKQFSPLFNPAMPIEAKAQFRRKILDRLTYANWHLVGREYLVGECFTVADSYLYTVARWATPLKLDISGLDWLDAFMTRVSRRPAVQKALNAEGLFG